jgi:hypothetical protein
MKKLLATLAVAGLAGGIGLATSPAQAACDSGPTAAGSSQPNPATGGTIYYDEPGGTSGTIGTSGTTGYIEASGDATGPSGHIQGSTSDGAVNGRIDNGGICVNDTSAP